MIHYITNGLFNRCIKVPVDERNSRLRNDWTYNEMKIGSPMKIRLQKVFEIKDGEIRAVLLSFIYFFSLLASYYVLRPIRDEMSMQLGSERLQENFFAVFIAMLVLVPIFGWITKNVPRGVALPRVYGFFVMNILFFYWMFDTKGLQLGWVARSFFVWVSVYNLFVVSVFWSFMADLFTTEQSSRLNGLISAGGTLGALVGPSITALFIESFGPKNLVLVSGGFLLLAIACVQGLRHERRTVIAKQIHQIEASYGFQGSIFSGILAVFQSRYLLGICVFLFLYALLSTFLYGMSTDLLPKVYTDSAQRTKILAQLDLIVNVLSFVSQLFLFSKLVGRFGRRVGLVFLPVLSVVGFLLFGMSQSIQILLVFAILRRAGEYSISKPTRETLFNVLPPEQKYRAKNVIDTLVHRTGDVSSASLFASLHKIGLGLQGFAFVSGVIAVVWTINSIWLGKKAEDLLAEAKAHIGDPGIHT